MSKHIAFLCLVLAAAALVLLSQAQQVQPPTQAPPAPGAPTYKKTYYPVPSHVRKRTSVLAAQTGYEWTFSVGCSMIPSEVDRIVTAFFLAAEYSQTLSTFTTASDAAAIPCYVVTVIQNVARTFVKLQCTTPTAVNVSKLDAFLRTGTILPLECRDRITVARNEAIRVKQDEPTSIVTQSTPGYDRWHLDRTDQRGLPFSHAYTYAYTGVGVEVNIVDTGIWYAHDEFGGRASSGGNFAFDNSPDVDGNGHGSHCAGICCGATNGPARGATIKSRRVLNDDGYGSFDSVMDALMLIEDEFVNSPSMKVVSMSLSGPVYTPVNELVNILALVHGIPVVVAAGNAGGNTNSYSPGSASGSIPVAASDTGDSMPIWSNRYDPCYS